MAIIAWIFSFVAGLAACIAGIRQIGVVSAIFGALCALASAIIYVAGVDSTFRGISAGWPCEVAAFVVFIVQAVLFVRVSKQERW